MVPMIDPLPIYRRWFHGLAVPLEVELDADKWHRSATEHLAALQRNLGGEIDYWHVDQDNGVLTLSSGDVEVDFRATIAGTHDGDTFCWSWDNPSVAPDLIPDREQVVSGLGSHREAFAEKNLPITVLDAWVLAGAAVGSVAAKGLYHARTDDTTVFMLVHEELARRGIALEPADEEPSFMEVIGQLMNPEPEELPDALHRESQRILNLGYSALNDGRATDACRLFEEAWSVLEPCKWPWETPITGPIRLGMAEAAYVDGEFVKAAALIEEAIFHRATAGVPLARTFYRLAQANRRLGLHDAASEAFLRAYVVGDASDLTGEDAQDIAVLDSTLASLWQRRGERLAGESTDSPEPVVYALIAALDAINTFAASRDPGFGRHFRSDGESAEEGDEDEFEEQEEEPAAERLRERENTVRWCELVAMWCTPGKRSTLGGYSSDSYHPPEKELVVETQYFEDGTAEVWTRIESESGALDHLYILVERSDGWWVQDAFDVYQRGEEDEESYTMF